MRLSKKDQLFVVLATSAGGIIEWYELFLYIYWSPLISELFFNLDSTYTASLKALFIFFVGFLGRPVGGILFGHIGDKYGRKTSFVKSIILVSLPSLAIGFFPFVRMGELAPFLLCIFRFLQGLPAGGELPGAMCYLAECTPKNRRGWACSFSFFGPQIGVILAMLECYLLEKWMPYDDLMSWGWRMSFIIGGVFGLIGFYIRRRLKESPLFTHLEKEKRVLHKPVLETILRHKKDLIRGFFASFLDVVGFYLFSIFIGIYFHKVLNIPKSTTLLIAASLMAFSTATLPFLGMLGDKYKIKNLLIFSAVGVLFLSVPFYFSVLYLPIPFSIFFQFLLMILLNIQFAFIPYLMAEMFPTSTRYTGIGMSFNLCDSLVGGITPFLALIFTHYIGDLLSFICLFSIAALVSLITFLFTNDKKINKISSV